jgi:hypothetical protein
LAAWATKALKPQPGNAPAFSSAEGQLKHATGPALDQLEPLLETLREIAGLRERKRGVFYFRSAAFLHFHEDPMGLYADLRRPDGDFMRRKVDTPEEWAAVATLAMKLSSPDAPD